MILYISHMFFFYMTILLYIQRDYLNKNSVVFHRLLNLMDVVPILTLKCTYLNHD